MLNTVKLKLNNGFMIGITDISLERAFIELYTPLDRRFITLRNATASDVSDIITLVQETETPDPREIEEEIVAIYGTENVSIL